MLIPVSHGDWNTGRMLPIGLCRLLATQHGAVGTLQALRYLSKATIAHLVGSGRWNRPHRGVLIAHNGPLSDGQRLWVAALAAGAGRPALLAGPPAQASRGLKGFPSDRVHVLVAAGRHPVKPPAGGVVHRTTQVTMDDLCLSQQPCTAVARSVVDAVSWARSDDEARTVVAMVVQPRMTTVDAMGSVLDRLPRAKRRRLVLAAAADADGGAQSLGELHAIRLIRRAGLPVPTSQQVRTDAAGRRRFIDLYWRQYRLLVEIDGIHHTDAQQAWDDAQRQNDLWVRGERILRFPAWVVRERPAAFIATLRRGLEAAGWSPGRD